MATIPVMATNLTGHAWTLHEWLTFPAIQPNQTKSNHKALLGNDL